MLPEIKKKYVETGALELIFLDFPLDFHPEAMAAAIAAGCAHEQAKFWAFHDLLFENAPGFDRKDFPGYAEDLGLDTAAFAQCREKKRPRAGIQQDIREGGFAGVRGTPTFLLGRRIQGKEKVEILESFGGLSYDDLAEKIERWLKQPQE